MDATRKFGEIIDVNEKYYKEEIRSAINFESVVGRMSDARNHADESEEKIKLLHEMIEKRKQDVAAMEIKVGLQNLLIRELEEEQVQLKRTLAMIANHIAHDTTTPQHLSSVVLNSATHLYFDEKLLPEQNKGFSYNVITKKLTPVNVKSDNLDEASLKIWDAINCATPYLDEWSKLLDNKQNN